MKSPRLSKRNPRNKTLISRKSPRVSKTKFTLNGGKRTDAERATRKCAGEMDIITLDEIPEKYAIRILNTYANPAKYECFDVMTLAEWFNNKKQYSNPMSGLLFNHQQVTKIYKKLDKLKAAGEVIPEIHMGGVFNHGGNQLVVEEMGNLMIEFAGNGNRDGVRGQMMFGINVNFRASRLINGHDVDGATSLIVAASTGSINVLEFLLYNFANIEDEDDHGFTALEAAIIYGHPETVRFLLKNGANPNHHYPLVIASHSSDGFPVIYSSVVALVDDKYHINLNQQNDSGDTALHVAVKQKNTNVVILLAKKGADPRIKNNEGKSALQYADNYTLGILQEYSRLYSLPQTRSVRRRLN